MHGVLKYSSTVSGIEQEAGYTLRVVHQDQFRRVAGVGKLDAVGFDRKDILGIGNDHEEA